MLQLNKTLKFTSKEFESACVELKAFVEVMASKCIADGFTFTPTDKAPESFKELKNSTINKHILVANYACDSSIYCDNETNILFRFWHDVSHLTLNEGFSLSGETKVISLQIGQAIDYGLSDLALLMFFYDTQGQVEYYFNRKAFVKNQVSFVKDCVKFGLTKILEIN